MAPTLHDGFSSDSVDEPVAAPFRGFRAFLIDDLKWPSPATPPILSAERFASGGKADGAKLRGSLRGIFMSDYVWGPGTNEAMCLRVRGPMGGVVARPQQHSRPVKECDCGFWAYTSGDHYLSVSGPAALGIVEGWGRVVIGPHGFRAEKARIVALCFPDRPADAQPGTQTPNTVGPQANLRVGSLSQLFAALGASMAAAAQALAAAFGARPAPQPAPTTKPSAAQVNRAARPWEDVDDDLRAAVVALYPAAKVFDTVAEMQRAFPLTDVAPLVPPREEGEDEECGGA